MIDKSSQSYLRAVQEIQSWREKFPEEYNKIMSSPDPAESYLAYVGVLPLAGLSKQDFLAILTSNNELPINQIIHGNCVKVLERNVD